MISYSTSEGPSGSSLPCARCGPRPTSSRRSTTRTAPRGASRTATCTRRSSSASGRRRGLPGVAAPLPGGHRVLRLLRLRPGGVQLERLGPRDHLRRAHHARLLLPQPVPVRVERPRAHPRRAPRPAAARCSRRSSGAGASGTGSPRSGWTATSTNSRTTQAPDPRVLGPRRRRWSTRRWRPTRFAPGRGGRALPGRCPSSCRTSASTSPCAPSTSWACRWWSAATAPRPAACGASPGRRSSFAGRVSDARGRAPARRLPRARGGRRGGVRDRRRGGPGRRPAGDRRARRRHARDRRRRRDGLLLARRPRRAGRRGVAASTTPPSTRTPACATPPASTPPSSSASCPARSRVPWPVRTRSRDVPAPCSAQHGSRGVPASETSTDAPPKPPG